MVDWSSKRMVSTHNEKEQSVQQMFLGKLGIRMQTYEIWLIFYTIHPNQLEIDYRIGNESNTSECDCLKLFVCTEHFHILFCEVPVQVFYQFLLRGGEQLIVWPKSSSHTLVNVPLKINMANTFSSSVTCHQVSSNEQNF